MADKIVIVEKRKGCGCGSTLVVLIFVGCLFSVLLKKSESDIKPSTPTPTVTTPEESKKTISAAVEVTQSAQKTVTSEMPISSQTSEQKDVSSNEIKIEDSVFIEPLFNLDTFAKNKKVWPKTLTLKEPAKFALPSGSIQYPAGTIVDLLDVSDTSLKVGKDNAIALVPTASTDVVEQEFASRFSSFVLSDGRVFKGITSARIIYPAHLALVYEKGAASVLLEEIPSDFLERWHFSKQYVADKVSCLEVEHKAQIKAMAVSSREKMLDETSHKISIKTIQIGDTFALGTRGDEIVCIMDIDTSGMIDERQYAFTVWETSPFRYITVLGANKTVPGYTASRNRAGKELGIPK
jgi:hypothetical protein